MSVVVARPVPRVSARPPRVVVVRRAFLSRDHHLEALALALCVESVRRYATYDYPVGGRCLSAARVLLGEACVPERRVIVAGRPS